MARAHRETERGCVSARGEGGVRAAQEEEALLHFLGPSSSRACRDARTSGAPGGFPSRTVEKDETRTWTKSDSCVAAHPSLTLCGTGCLCCVAYCAPRRCPPIVFYVFFFFVFAHLLRPHPLRCFARREPRVHGVSHLSAYSCLRVLCPTPFPSAVYVPDAVGARTRTAAFPNPLRSRRSALYARASEGGAACPARTACGTDVAVEVRAANHTDTHPLVRGHRQWDHHGRDVRERKRWSDSQTRVAARMMA